MILSADQVYQALVLSSIFLMAISLPKLAIYMIWAAFRTFVFENMLGSKMAREVLSEATMRRNLKPDKRFHYLLSETDSYARELKRPVAELFSAALLLPVSASRLQVESDAALVIVVFEALMITVLLIAFATLARRFLKMKESKGGGPLA